MDLKEKILKENLLSIKDRNIQKNVGDRWMQFNSEKSTVAIYEAMDELSKIVAIAFGKFISTHRLDFQPASPDGYWIGLDMEYYSTEALYEQFIQSKDYQELMDAK